MMNIILFSILNILPNILAGMILGAVAAIIVVALSRLVFTGALFMATKKVQHPVFIWSVVIVLILLSLYIMITPDVMGGFMVVTFLLCMYKPLRNTMRRHLAIYRDYKIGQKAQ